MKQLFIKTKDIDTKNLLIKEGFKLVSENQGVYTFLNDKKLTYSEGAKHVTYSDILSI